MAYQITSPDVPEPRTYTSFSQGLQEGIDLRIYQGIHFRTADVQGADLGPEGRGPRGRAPRTDDRLTSAAPPHSRGRRHRPPRQGLRSAPASEGFGIDTESVELYWLLLSKGSVAEGAALHFAVSDAPFTFQLTSIEPDEPTN